MKISILTICFLLLCIEINSTFSWRRRRRRRAPCYPINCKVGSWSVWSSCSHPCGTNGTQNRTRQKTFSAQCGGQCPYHLVVTRSCNRGNCHNGSTPNSGGCSCRLGYEGTCCEKGESFLKNLRIQKFAYSGSETMDQGLGVSILKRLVKTIHIHNQRYDNRRNFQTAESC